MTLVASGTISIGGSITASSINLELGLAYNYTSSLNDTAFRTLAQKTTVSSIISLSDFYGKSNITSLFYTSNTTWTVPTGVTSITVRCWGAGGTDGDAPSYWPDWATNVGGDGGFSKATVTVTPGETLYIRVGTYNGLNGGGAGGAATGAYGGNGGGYTGAYRSSLTQANVLVMAGGGGGGGAAGSDGLGAAAGAGSDGNEVQTSTTPFSGLNGVSDYVEDSYGSAGGGGGGGYTGGWGGGASAGDAGGGYGGTARVTGSSTFTYHGLYTSDPFYNSSYGGNWQNGYLVITY